MRWISNKKETWEEEKARKAKWHNWFAWHPVVIAKAEMPNGEIKNIKVWLETIQRRGEFWCYHDGYDGWKWEYRNDIRFKEGLKL